MLPSSHRLPSPLIRTVLGQGRRFQSGGLCLYGNVGAGTVSRFAVVVGKSLDKKATVRNRMKRLIRESLQELLPFLSRNTDGVVVLKRKLPGSATLIDVKRNVRELFAIAKLLKQSV